MQATHDDAMQIYQTHLDGVDRALEHGDFDSYAPHFAAVHVYKSLEGHIRIANADALRLFFDALRDALERHELVTLDRVCNEAEFVDATTIRGQHRTRLVRRGAIVTETYSVRCELMLEGGRWRLVLLDIIEGPAVIPSTVITHVLERQKRAR